MMTMVGLAIWLSLVYGKSKGGIFNRMADYNAYLVPGVIVAYVAGILQPFATRSAALVCILFGPFASILFEQLARWGFDHSLQAFHRAAFATIACYAVLLAVSFVTQNERNAESEQFTWSQFRRIRGDSASNEAVDRRSDRFWAVLLVVCTLAMCWYFR